MVPSAPMAAEDLTAPFGGEFPLDLAVLRVERIEVAIIRADVNGAIFGDGRGGDHPLSGVVLPFQRAVRMERIETIIQ